MLLLLVGVFTIGLDVEKLKVVTEMRSEEMSGLRDGAS